MTVDECRNEVYSLEEHFSYCEREGHGISSKETVRHRLCSFKVKYFDDLGGTLELGEDVWEFMKNGHLMFAEVDCKCGICHLYELEKKAKAV